MLEGFEVFEQFVREGWYGNGLTGSAVNAMKAGKNDIRILRMVRLLFTLGHWNICSGQKN